jgi:hypothetical protein
MWGVCVCARAQTCWLVRGSTGTVAATDRTYGCSLTGAASSVSPCPQLWQPDQGGPVLQTPGQDACIPTFANGTLGTQLITVAPRVAGYAFLGEPEKLVAVSKQRFTALSVSGAGVLASLRGAPFESVTVGVLFPDSQVAYFDVPLDAGGRGAFNSSATSW